MQRTVNMGTLHRVGPSTAITYVRSFSFTSTTPVSSLALSALSKVFFMKSFDSTACLLPLGFGNVTIEHDPNELMRAAASSCVGFDFLF